MSIDDYTIAFIGLGEAASTIIAGWGNHRNKQVQAYDIKLQECLIDDPIFLKRIPL